MTPGENDMTLVHKYAASQSEPAFAELVQRHIPLVYSAAMRQVGDSHLAEEIAQSVFIALAQKATKLNPNTILSAWLYRATHFAALNALHEQRRRQIREQEAYMQSTLNKSEENAWTQLAPVLDGAMNKLGETDRAALVMKFFQNKSAKEIADALHIKEDAAQKRIGRALEKLRSIFAENGVTGTAATISGVISANSVQAAPVALAKAVTAAALTKGATASTSTLTLVKGALKIMAWTKSQTAIVTTVVLVLAAGVAVVAVKKGPAHARAISQTPSDTTALQGSWSGQENGGPAGATLTFDGTNLDFHGANPNEWYKATFTLRADTTPKQLIAVITDCVAPQYVGKTSYAIYQVQGDTLTFVGNEPGMPNPPAAFDGAGGRKFVFSKK